MTTENPESITERVRFWEEQDKINQELIPRVIRQNELLTNHIADHENLPEVAGNAISQALAGAREEQRQEYETAIAELRAEAEAQCRQHESELQAARDERQQQAEALDAARAEREEQSRQHSNEVATLQEQLRKAKTMFTGVAAGAAAISIAALVVSFLI